MTPSPFRRTPPSIACFVAFVCSVALADDAPSKKGSAPSFVGTKAGQVRDDNSLKMKLVWCPAGSFTMGSPKSEKDREFNEAQAQVTLTRGFWLGQTEVTRGQWSRVMHTSPWIYWPRQIAKHTSLPGRTVVIEVKEGDDYPVTFVTWDDAVTFCKKLTEQERRAGRLPAVWRYTLPTEAQWEYACRAGTTTRFSFGDDESKLGTYAWFRKNTKDVGQPYVHQVGRKRPNLWGLYDMHGNVSEWCRDAKVQRLPGGFDPEVTYESDHRACRGGGGDYNPAAVCRSAWRGVSHRTTGSGDGGFRVALEQSGK